MGSTKPVKEFLENLVDRSLKEGEVTFLDWKATCVINSPGLYHQLASKANAELGQLELEGVVQWEQPFSDRSTDRRWYIEIRGSNAKAFLRKHGKEYNLR